MEQIIEDCKTVVLEESEKLYNVLTDQLLASIVVEERIVTIILHAQ